MANPKTKDLRILGVAMAAVLGGLGVWQFVKGRSLAGGILVSVAVYFAAGIAAPALIRPVYGPWMAVAKLLGQVMTKVILFVSFCLVITPISLVRRLFGRDGLDRRIERDASSYWCERDGTELPKERYERLF